VKPRHPEHNQRQAQQFGKRGAFAEPDDANRRHDRRTDTGPHRLGDRQLDSAER
jgi:hypothetical protein